MPWRKLERSPTASASDSMLVFTSFQPNAALPADTFVFTPPKGADVAEQ